MALVPCNKNENCNEITKYTKSGLVTLNFVTTRRRCRYQSTSFLLQSILILLATMSVFTKTLGFGGKRYLFLAEGFALNRYHHHHTPTPQTEEADFSGILDRIETFDDSFGKLGLGH